MWLHSVTLRGISTAFKASTVHLDFDAMPPGLVALVGPNGAGKTTLLEATGPLPIYRRSPSYDESFVDRIVPGVRDAAVMLDFSLGDQRYEVTVRGDPLFSGGRGKTEAVLAVPQRDGTPRVIAGPTVREFDAAIAGILPPEDVFLASAFAAQGGVGSFFAMKPAERKDVLVVLLGLGRLQTMAEYAHQSHQSTMRELAVLDDAVDQAQAAAADAERLRAEVAEVARALADAVATRDRLAGEVEQARAKADEARTRHAECKTRADAPVHIPEQAEKVADARRALESAERDAAQADAAATAATQAHAAAVRSLGDFQSTRERIRRQRAAIVDPPTEGVDVLRQRLEAASTAHQTEREKLDAAEAALAVAHRANGERAIEEAALARERAVALLLDDIPGVPECDTCPLTADARLAREQASRRAAAMLGMPAPALDVASAAVTRHRAILDATRRDELALTGWVATAERMAALGVEQAIVDSQVSDAGIEEARTKTAAVEAQTHAGTVRATLVAAAQAALDGVLAAERAAIAAATEDARRALADATVMRQARESARDVAVQDHTRALAAAETAAVTHARIAERLATAEAACAQLDRQRAEQRTARARLVDWSMTERVLGREGAQALAIDAAGPGISSLANELLLACYGPRFQLRFVTTEPKKSGDGFREVMEVAIYDAEQGRVARRGSGGEMVVLDEALRLAIALYNVRHHGFACDTLWRDETAGALSPEHAERYIALLRRAREVGGFRHVVFIAHQREVWSAAETQVHVANGAVEVR